MSFGNRLDKLERAFGPEERTVQFFVYTPNWPDGPDPEIPDWAEQVVTDHLDTRPWLGGIQMVRWTKAMDCDEFQVEIDGEHFEVTPDGLVPVPAPVMCTFTLKLDNPNGAGPDYEEER